MNTNLDQKNYSLNFGEIFNEAWNLFTKTIGMGILAVIIYLIASGLIGLVIESLTGFNAVTQGFAEDIQGISNPESMLYKLQEFYTENLNLILVSRLTTELILLLAFPLAAGFILVCREMDQKGYAGISTLFSTFKPEYWGRLMVLAVVYFVVSKIATMFFILPGIYVWTAACIACPFVLFKNMNGVEAFTSSIKMVNKKWFDVFKLLFVASLIGVSGYLLCGIGRIATYPFVLVMVYMLYKNMVGFDEDEISEIGKE